MQRNMPISFNTTVPAAISHSCPNENARCLSSSLSRCNKWRHSNPPLSPCYRSSLSICLFSNLFRTMLLISMEFHTLFEYRSILNIIPCVPCWAEQLRIYFPIQILRYFGAACVRSPHTSSNLWNQWSGDSKEESPLQFISRINLLRY